MSDIIIEIIDPTPTFSIDVAETSSAIIVPSEVRAALESLPSTPTDERLDASAIKNLPTGRISWEIVSSNSNAEVNKGYLVNSLSLISITLPSVAEIGDEILVYGESSTSWRISQGINQQIKVGNKLTTLGVTGEILGREVGDGIHLVCVSNDANKWISIKVFGNIDVI